MSNEAIVENRKLDMSLDEIIQMDGITGNRRGRGRSGGDRFGGTNGRRDNFSRGNNDRRFQPKRLNNGNNGGFRSLQFNGDRNYSGGQSANRYTNGGGLRGQMNGFGGGNNRRHTTLHVSNLAPTVNSEDVEELFSTFGDLVRSFVHYDQHGTSLKTAEVVFETRNCAFEARNKLNGVPLDGKPLRIAMLEENDQDDSFTSYLRMGNPRQRNDQQQHRNYQNNRPSNRMSNRGGGGNRMGGGRRDNNRNGGPAPSVEDLDKDMDEWRMQIDADQV